MTLKRTKIPFQHYIRQPTHTDMYMPRAFRIVERWGETDTVAGPLCLTCGRPVDQEMMVEGEPGRTTGCRVLVRHHGAEEVRDFDFGSVEWDHDDLRKMTRSNRWFDPTKHDDGDARVTVPARIGGPEAA